MKITKMNRLIVIKLILLFLLFNNNDKLSVNCNINNNKRTTNSLRHLESIEWSINRNEM
jgi:hypothetical protein